MSWLSGVSNFGFLNWILCVRSSTVCYSLYSRLYAYLAGAVSNEPSNDVWPKINSLLFHWVIQWVLFIQLCLIGKIKSIGQVTNRVASVWVTIRCTDSFGWMAKMLLLNKHTFCIGPHRLHSQLEQPILNIYNSFQSQMVHFGLRFTNLDPFAFCRRFAKWATMAKNVANIAMNATNYVARHSANTFYWRLFYWGDLIGARHLPCIEYHFRSRQLYKNLFIYSKMKMFA